MKAFFSRKHDSQTGQSKSALKDPFKLWNNNNPDTERKNPTKQSHVQTGVLLSQAKSDRTSKATGSLDKVASALPAGANTEVGIYRTTRTNTVPQSTYNHNHPSTSQPPPKTSTIRPRDYDELKYHPPPRAATSTGFFTTTLQAREERTKNSRGHLRNEAAAIPRREIWVPATMQAKPVDNPDEKYRFTEEPETYRGYNKKEPKEARREDRKFKRDGEDRGFTSDREVDRDYRYQKREKARREIEAERVKELEAEKEKVRTREKEREREREVEREKAREREKRVKEERGRQREIEREREREQERQKEAERERERDREKREIEKDQRERTKQEVERERERQREQLRQEIEREKEQDRERQRGVERERERERVRQDIEKEKERQREKERQALEREKEREKQKESERQREQEKKSREYEAGERDKLKEYEREQGKQDEQERWESRDKTRDKRERRDLIEGHGRLHRELDVQRDKEQERELKEDLSKARVVDAVDYRRERTLKDRHQIRERYLEQRTRGEATDSEQEIFGHKTSTDHDRRRSGRTSDNYANYDRRSSRQVRQEPLAMDDGDTSSEDFVILDPLTRQDQLANVIHPKSSQNRQHHLSGSVNSVTGNLVLSQHNPTVQALLSPYTTPRIAPALLPLNDTRTTERPPPPAINTTSTGAAQDARRGISRTKLDNREDWDSAQQSSEPPNVVEPPRRPPSRASVMLSQVQRSAYASAPSQAMHKQSMSQSVIVNGTVDGNREILHTRVRSEDLKAATDAASDAYPKSNSESGRLRSRAVDVKELPGSTGMPMNSLKEPQLSNASHFRIPSDGQKETRAVSERHMEPRGGIRDSQRSRDAQHVRRPSEENSYRPAQVHAVLNSNDDIENYPDNEIGSVIRPLTALDSTGRPWVPIPGIPQLPVQMPTSQTMSLPPLEPSNPETNPFASVQTTIPSVHSQLQAGNSVVRPSAPSSNAVFVPAFSGQVVHAQQPIVSLSIGPSAERSDATTTTPPVLLHTIPPLSNSHGNIVLPSAETVASVSTPLPPLRSFAPLVRPHAPNGNYATPIRSPPAEGSTAAAAAQNVLLSRSTHLANEVSNLATAIIPSALSFTPPLMRFHPLNGGSATPFDTSPEVLASTSEIGHKISQSHETCMAKENEDPLTLSKAVKEETMTKLSESSRRPSPKTSRLNMEKNITGQGFQQPTHEPHTYRPQASGSLPLESFGVEHNAGHSEAHKRHFIPRTQFEVESAKAIYTAGVRLDASMGVASETNQNPTPDQIVSSTKRSSTTAMKEDVRSPLSRSLFNMINDKEAIQHLAQPLSPQPMSDSLTQGREAPSQEQMVTSSYKPPPINAGTKMHSVDVYEPLHVSYPVTHQPFSSLPSGSRKMASLDEAAHAVSQEQVGLSISRPTTRTGVKKDVAPHSLLERQYTRSQDSAVHHLGGFPVPQPTSKRECLITSQFPPAQGISSEKQCLSQDKMGIPGQPMSAVIRNNATLNNVATDNGTPPQNRLGRGAETTTAAAIRHSEESPKLSSQMAAKMATADAGDNVLGVNARKTSMEHSVAPLVQSMDVDDKPTLLASAASRDAIPPSHSTKQDAPFPNPVVANPPFVTHVSPPSILNGPRTNAKHDMSTFPVQSTLHVPPLTCAEGALLVLQADVQGTESAQQLTSVVDKVESQKSILQASQPNIPILASDVDQTSTSQGDGRSVQRMPYGDSQPRLQDSLLERPKHEMDQTRRHLPREGTPPFEYHAPLPPHYGKNMNNVVHPKDQSTSNQAGMVVSRNAAVTVQSDEQTRLNRGSTIPPQYVQGDRTTTQTAPYSAKVSQGSGTQNTGATTSRETRPPQPPPLHRHLYASSIHVHSTPFPSVQELPRSAAPVPCQTQIHAKPNAGLAAEKPLLSLSRGTASEETILMTPASLAPSLSLKPTTSRQSKSESVNSQASKRSGLLSRFRRKSSQAQNQEGRQPLPPSKTPDSSPGHTTPLDVRVTSHPALNTIQPVPISSRNPDYIFTPFKHLTSRKKKRSLSSASMEARDGETSTVIGSPTMSVLSSTSPIPLPANRDPWQATHDWLVREEDHAQARPKGRRHRPGVVIDAGEDAPEDREHRGLKRNPTKHRSSARRQELVHDS